MIDTVKDVAQIIYYITLSIAGPLALIEFLKARKADRRANEYKIYDELNGHFFEYQKIALEYYDLDILDVPNSDPSLSFDKKRKQEMVAHAMRHAVLASRAGLPDVLSAGRSIPASAMVRLEAFPQRLHSPGIGANRMAGEPGNVRY